MKLLGKIFAVGVMGAALGLSSTAAFASTTNGGPPPSSYGNTNCLPDPHPTLAPLSKSNGGNKGNPCDPNSGNKGNPCDTNGLDSIFWHNSQSGGYTLFSDSKDCTPVVSDPCKWDKIPVTAWVWQQTGKSGRYVKCTRDENWNNCTPRPVTPPCPCKTQNITFQLPTYGTWLLDVGGPALHNGETIKYDGATWTVQDWTTGANGSQGHGTYFVLKDGTTTLKGLGTGKSSPGLELYEHATTICTTLHPVRSFA
jgi:hypothetical protein